MNHLAAQKNITNTNYQILIKQIPIPNTNTKYQIPITKYQYPIPNTQYQYQIPILPPEQWVRPHRITLFFIFNYSTLYSTQERSNIILGIFHIAYCIYIYNKTEWSL